MSPDSLRVITDQYLYLFCEAPSILSSEKVEVYPTENSAGLLAAQRFSCKDFGEFTPKAIPTENVYLSINLDAILGFPTIWPRAGQLEFRDVEQIVSKICGSKEIIGADICGFSPFAAQGTVQEPLEQMYGLYNILKEGMSA